MAKIIENLYIDIQTVGKKILLEEGYNQMTLRLVASKCNIATGTIYNYFKSKDMLVATIMFKDWEDLLKKTNPKVDKAKEAIDGLELIFNMIKDYTAIYQKAWIDYGGSLIGLKDRHSILIKQLSEMINPLFKRFELDDTSTSFISEILIYSAIREDVSFSDIKPFILKIMN